MAGDEPLLSADDRRRGINHPAVPYAIVGVILAAIGLIIFWRSGYIAGGDIWPTTFVPGNNAWQQNWPVWGPTVTGIGSPQYNPTTLVWSLFGRFVGLFHLQGPHQQDVFLVALLVSEGLGTTYLARALYPKRPLMAVIAGLAVPLSLYNAIAFLNPIQAFAIGWFPFSAGIIVNARGGPWYLKSVRLGLLTLGLWVLAGTPPMAVVWVAWAAVWFGFSSRRHRRYVGRTVIASMLLALMLNGWWAYGALLTLGGGSVSQTFSGPLAWAWVNQRASLLNLLSMQGDWAWFQRVYYPWGTVYQHGALPWLLFVPALLAVISVLWVRIERSRWIWVGWIVGSLWLAQGTHPPFGWLNTWLYTHVPLFWLFRDPQVEMDIILLIGLMMLASMAIDDLWRRWKQSSSSLEMSVLGGALVMVIGVALTASGYGVYSGKAFPRHASSHNTTTSTSNIHVPPYWGRAAKFLNSSENQGGRILLLPNDDFYQMPYQWGYYGTDSVAQSYFHAPVVLLNPNPSGYLAGTANYQATLSQLYTAIQSHPRENIAPMLRTMGIHWIVEREDINWQVPGRTILPAPYVMWYLAHQPGIHKVRTIGALSIYRVHSYQSVVSVASHANTWSGSAVPPLIIPRALTSKMPHRNAVWVSGNVTSLPIDQRVTELPVLDSNQVLHISTTGSLYLRPTTVAVQVRLRAGHLIVRLAGLPINQGDRVIQWTRTTEMPLPPPLPRTLGVQVGGNHYSFSTQSQAVRAGNFATVGSYILPTESGTTTIRLLRGHQVPLNTEWSPVGNCNAYAALPSTLTQLWERELSRGGVELHANAQAACSVKTSRTSLAPGLISLSVRSKHIAGQLPVVALQVGRHVVTHIVLGVRSSWTTWTQYTGLPVRGPVAIFAYSFATPGQPTINDYRVSMTEFGIIGQRTISLKGKIFPITAGRIVQRSASLGPNMVPNPLFQKGLWSPIFDANAYRKESFTQAGIKGYAENGVLFLQARSDGAGEGETISGVGGDIITIRVDARTLEGQPAAVSLVNTSTGKVLWSSSLPAGQSGWHTLSAVLPLPQSVDAVSLDLYAYGGGVSPTVTEYRKPSIRAWNPGVQTMWVITGRTTSEGGGHAVVAPSNGSEYHVTLASGDRLLILHTTYSSRWTIMWRGIPQPWKHIRVDGIYNAWVIPTYIGSAHDQVILTFGPSRLYRILWWVAIGVALTLVLYLLVRQLRSPRLGSRNGVST